MAASVSDLKVAMPVWMWLCCVSDLKVAIPMWMWLSPVLLQLNRVEIALRSTVDCYNEIS